MRIEVDPARPNSQFPASFSKRLSSTMTTERYDARSAERSHWRERAVVTRESHLPVAVTVQQVRPVVDRRDLQC